jgi:predicted dehydrogenase
MSKKKWKIAGINFDHMHMGDLLRLVEAHPNAEIVGVCDERLERTQSVVEALSIPANRVYSDYDRCMKESKPDLVILCPATAEHALWTERVAPYGTHILMEKPFASSLADCDRMTAAMAETGKELIINWPLRWYPSHITAKRLIDEGEIGVVTEVHYYDGNRGPLYHGADKIVCEPTAEEKSASWWYKEERGGGSLLDYLGYGATLGTWFHGNRIPIEVMAMTDRGQGLEVDEHSITLARYECGLSRFETRWGTFTDPWTFQPQPKCGFVVKGSEGSIASYDYEATISLQTRARPEAHDIPVDDIAPSEADPLSYTLNRLENDLPIEGPLSPSVCRIGQQIVDTASLSAKEKRLLPLCE